MSQFLRSPRWLRVGAALTALLPLSLLAQPAAPSPVGLWHTIDDGTGKPRAEIRIAIDNDRLVGTVVRSLVPGEVGEKRCDKCPGARRNQPMIGLAILTGLKRDRENPLLWSGGEVLDPDQGKVYKARVELAPDGRSLKMRGYIGVAMLGRTQTWTRASE